MLSGVVAAKRELLELRRSMQCYCCAVTLRTLALRCLQYFLGVKNGFYSVSLKINNLLKGEGIKKVLPKVNIAGVSTNVDTAQNTSQIFVNELLNAIYRNFCLYFLVVLF